MLHGELPMHSLLHYTGYGYMSQSTAAFHQVDESVHNRIYHEYAGGLTVIPPIGIIAIVSGRVQSGNDLATIPVTAGNEPGFQKPSPG